jgi:hypothetical protein
MSLPMSLRCNAGLGVHERGSSGRVAVYSARQMASAMRTLKLKTHHLVGPDGPTKLGADLEVNFKYRATVLNKFVQPRLMDADEVRAMFTEMRTRLTPTCRVPFNKQKGDKAGLALFTGMINMLIELTAKVWRWTTIPVS